MKQKVFIPISLLLIAMGMLVFQGCRKTVDEFNPFNPENNQIEDNTKNNDLQFARIAPLLENFSEDSGSLSFSMTIPVRESYKFLGIKHYVIYIDFYAIAYGDPNVAPNKITDYNASHHLVKVTPFGNYSIGDAQDHGFSPPASTLSLSWHYTCSGVIELPGFGVHMFTPIDSTLMVHIDNSSLL